MESYTIIECKGIDPVLKELLIARWSEEALGFEEAEQGLIITFPSTQTVIELEKQLKKEGVDYHISGLKSQNWNLLWESNFAPVIVSDFVEIIADFHSPSGIVKHTIHITPKMSFGTGHHATTYLMIESMEKIDFLGKSVVDYGTGTGVLAILASKLGASAVIAIDNDDWSIENVHENIFRNNCAEIAVIKGDSIDGMANKDIILMNINKNVILENLCLLPKALKKAGLVLFSGLLVEDEKDIVNAFPSNSLKHISTEVKNNWICILAMHE